MAIRSAWWMREPATPRAESGSRQSNSTSHHLQPHQNWPNRGSNGLAFKQLEQYLRENPGTYCSVHQLYYSYYTGKIRAVWGRDRKAKSSLELETLLLERWPEKTHCALYLVSCLSAEALQMLGFHLKITPRFFNFPYSLLSTGVPVNDFTLFGLQVMEKYSHGNLPTEAKRSSNSPKMVFRTKRGQSNHTWHVTRINVVFIRFVLERPCYNGVIVFDPADQAFVEALLALATNVEEELPGLEEHRLGLPRSSISSTSPGAVSLKSRKNISTS